VPSVTTILGAAIAKPELMNWYGRLGTKEAERQRDEAADFGGRVHDAIEQYYTGLAGIPPRPGSIPLAKLTEDKRVEQALSHMIAWADKNIAEWVDFEQAVYHDELMYAGTTDAYVILKSGKLVLCDFKTSKSMRDEYHLQVAAYRGATRCESAKVDLAAVQGAFILHMDRDALTWSPHTARPHTECFPVFEACLKVYNWKKSMEGSWRG